MKKKIVYQYKNFIKIFKMDIDNKYLKIKNFHRIELNDATMVVIKNTSTNKILLLKEYRMGFNKVSFGLPGGFVDVGEKPYKTIKRECMEELGINRKKVKKICSYIRNGNYYGGAETVFSAETSETKIKTENQVDYIWASTKEIISLIKKGEFGTPGLLAAILYYIYMY